MREKDEVRRIVVSGKAPPSHDQLTAEDKAALAWLDSEPFSIKDMVLGRLSQHKRELVAAFSAMSKDEKDEFMT